MTYVHLGRYAKPTNQSSPVVVTGDGTVWANGRRWNLRTGEKSGFVPGFHHSQDGRYMQYGDGQNELVHPGGGIVGIGPVAALPQGGQFVGSYFVAGDSHGTRPKLVIDEAGKEVGRLAQTAKNPGLFNPQDGKTLWLNEQTSLAQHDIASLEIVRKIDAPNGTEFAGLAVLGSGHVATWERKPGGDLEMLVVFDAANKRVAERAHRGMSIAPLGKHFVVADDKAKQFVIVDTALEIVETVPMWEPGRDGHNSVVGMPSGREWIAMGGRGEWDHYGERGLGPSGGGGGSAKPAVKTKATPAAKEKVKPAAKGTAKPAAKTKPAATGKAKPAAKPPAKKSAAKRK